MKLIQKQLQMMELFLVMLVVVLIYMFMKEQLN
jgi:hypothetical protein